MCIRDSRLPNYLKEEKKCTERALELLDIFHMADLANVQAGSLPYGCLLYTSKRYSGISREAAAARQAAMDTARMAVAPRLDLSLVPSALIKMCIRDRGSSP